MTAPLDFFRYENGHLTADDVHLEDIADQVGTPCYVYSAEAFLKPLAELQKGLQGLDHLVCFAVKSCSNLAVINLLADAGTGVDLVSGGELYRAATAGVPGEKVVFSGVGKTPGEMAAALTYGEDGIYSFNVESVAELATLNQVAQGIGKRASVALRFNPDVDAKTHPYISTGLKKNKFGMTRAEILKIASGIEAFEAIDFRGVSIHIGSQLLSLSPIGDAFAKLVSLVQELDRLLPEPIRFIDLGGGLGITYKNEKSPSVSGYCKLIHKHFGARSPLKRQLKILVEPGRSISGNAGILLTEVLYRKVRGPKDFLIVDAGMNDLMRPSLYGSYHEIVPLRKTPSSPAKKTDIVGPVCESSDCFASDRKLSSKINQGDLLAILSTGAYGYSMAGTYNSRPRPAEVLIQKGKFRIIRERETYEDLIRGEALK